MTQEGVVAATGPHQMRGQRSLVGAHGPDVEVVNLSDTFETAQIFSAPRQARCRAARRRAQFSTLLRASPHPLPEHHGGDHKANGGIEPQPARQHDDQSRDHHPERDTGIGHHVQIGAANIEVAVPAAHEQERGAAINDDAERRNQNDGQPATGAGSARRLTASTTIPPTATSNSPALNSAARIEARR